MPAPAYDELDWRSYQRRAAEFFDKLEMETEIEAKIDGARSTHAVDVAVRFTSYGIDHLWIVECKLWRQKVHKEQVLALRGVVDDVGGDCGFLLSETGFDPAAVTAARMSNVTLTNRTWARTPRRIFKARGGSTPTRVSRGARTSRTAALGLAIPSRRRRCSSQGWTWTTTRSTEQT
jgi:hypothetical protein